MTSDQDTADEPMPQGRDGAPPVPISATDLVAALADEDGRLSALEKKLAEFVLSDVNFATTASITEIAAKAGVSPPTVTRFCRRLGCASFSDFRVVYAFFCGQPFWLVFY